MSIFEENGAFKGSIFLKNRHFLIQEMFDELIYAINTVIKCDICLSFMK